MAAVWIPPMDRSKFVSNMMASSLGAAVAMPICGFLIVYLGWESVFYVTGKIISIPICLVPNFSNEIILISCHLKIIKNTK